MEIYLVLSYFCTFALVFLSSLEVLLAKGSLGPNATSSLKPSLISSAHLGAQHSCAPTELYVNAAIRAVT